MASNFLFQIHPTSGVPIYRQLMDQVQAQIHAGRLPAGEMLPSVPADGVAAAAGFGASTTVPSSS